MSGASLTSEQAIVAIVDYACGRAAVPEAALDTARDILFDALACLFPALDHPECMQRVRPLVPGAVMTGGARVPGTSLELDPVQAAFGIGTMIGWRDFDCVSQGAAVTHPARLLAAVLAAADYRARRARAGGDEPPTVGDLLPALVRAAEIEGALAAGCDGRAFSAGPWACGSVAAAAMAARLLGGGRDAVASAVSHAWIDGSPLRDIAEPQHAAARRFWAGADAVARGVRLALMAVAGEPGIPAAALGRRPDGGPADIGTLALPAGGCPVIDALVFRPTSPGELHAQTAVEAAVRLHDSVRERLDDIDTVAIETQGPAARLAEAIGESDCEHDRDRSIRYLVAVGLVRGGLWPADFHGPAAAGVAAIARRAAVTENVAFTRDLVHPGRRSIANALQVNFTDGSSTDRVVIDYPEGHPQRRETVRPLLQQKFRDAVSTRVRPGQWQALAGLREDPERLAALPVDEFVALTVV